MKRLLISAALCLLPTLALAEDKRVNLSFDQAQMAILGEALAALPYGRVKSLIDDIIAQQEATARAAAPPHPRAPELKIPPHKP